ncbi:MAG: DUF1761 domain-containing protein [Chitinophagales bacterium]
MNSKVLIAAIGGAIFHFLLGWLVFGILLMDSMESNMTEGMKSISRGKDAYIYWAFGVGSFVTALLFALILNRFGVRTFMKGAVAGLWIGALMAWAYDFQMYAQFTMMDLNMVLMDAVFSGIFMALVAGVIGWLLGMGNKKTAA